MQKYLILIALLSLTNLLFPQISFKSSAETQNEVKIIISNDETNRLLKNSISAIDTLPDESQPGSPRLMSKTLYIAIPPSSKISAELVKKNFNIISNYTPKVNPKVTIVKDSIIKYEEMKLEKKYFVSDNYPANDIEVLGYTWLRDYYVAIVKVNYQKFNWKKNECSILKDGEILISFKEIKPFTINRTEDKIDNSLSSLIVNYEQAKSFKSYPALAISDTSDNWIDYSKEYVKLKISRDGIYRITYSDLVSYGIAPQSINPKTFKLFNKGKQIPLFVSGEDDFVFNDNDFIEFWAERNYSNSDYTKIVSPGTDYINYFDRYTDTTFVWLTWDGANGKRASIGNSPVSPGSDPLNTRKEKIHLEQDKRLWYYDATVAATQLPFWRHNKVFTWQAINDGDSVSFTFNASSFLSNTYVKTNIRLISNASNIQTNAHKVDVSLNTVKSQNPITFNFKQTVNFTSQLPSYLLKTGTNTLKVHVLPTEASMQQVLVDWIDIEFDCSNDAINDSLLIIIPDNISRGFRTVTINNVNAAKEDLILCKIKPDVKQFINYQLVSNTISFSDTLGSNDAYILLKKDKVFHPIFLYKKYFNRLVTTSEGTDYIIISNKVLNSSANHYADFIKDKYNLRTKLFFVDEIFDEFSYGYLNAEAIKAVIRHGYNTWITPKPSYLLLIGDANYDYKDVWNLEPAQRRKNLVPSYGNPVSDSWYVMFDSTNTSLPQMCVGRIPANNNQEVENYLTKHDEYISRKNDDWNKKFLLFSGGDTKKTSELAQIKAVNDTIFSRYVKPFPLGGNGKHFYKTVEPLTNFGPYTQKEVQDAIDSGGVYISYIGHSGTQTWDNGITKVSDLKNSFSDRFPIMSDFGCSTGKFAEPDVDAFGELFVSGSPDGQAINYLGNASLGFLSTSVIFPGYFCNSIIPEKAASIGLAHLQAKLKLLNEQGFSDVNRVFCYCNLLFGDPIIPVAIPKLPNFVIKQNSISINSNDLSDQADSADLKLTISNEGLGVSDSLTVNYSDTYKDTVSFQKSIKIPHLLNKSEVDLMIPVRGKAGLHKVSVKLDEGDLIREIDEADNSQEYSFNIYNASLRSLSSDKYYSISNKELHLLNPVQGNKSALNNISIELSDNPNFTTPTKFNKKMDTLITKLTLGSNLSNKRYWWRAKVDLPNANWTESFSFNKLDKVFNWYIDEKFKAKDIYYNGTSFDTLLKSWRLEDSESSLKISSAGSNDGEFASMAINAKEKLPSTFFWGIAAAEIDTVTLMPIKVKYFVNPPSQSADSLIKYINRLPQGTRVAMAICADAAQAVLGAPGTPVRSALKNLGSYYADSIDYRDSWCIFGKKGAVAGTVPEVYKKRYQGSAVIQISKTIKRSSGEILFPVVSNSFNWKNVVVNRKLPAGSKLEILPIVINYSQADTLAPLQFNSDTASISHLNSNNHANIRLLAKLTANSMLESPEINSIGISYTSLPELCLNYQVVSVSRDTVLQGDSLRLKFMVYNAGEAPADTFKVKVELIKPDNSIRLIMDSLVTRIDSMHHKEFNLLCNLSHYDGTGNMKFKVSIDTDNKVPELYEDNNIYEISFFVKPDTPTTINSASVAVQFDGVDITNGDYVSSNPEISINLNYPLWFPVYDSTAIAFYVDNEKIKFSQMNIFSDTINRKAVYKYKPLLPDGEHSFKVHGNEITGEIGNTPGYEVVFNVSNELKLMNVFNYPNPLKDNTNFTFVLTKAPDELRIKIFTVAGRLIKEINGSSYSVHTGFNSIPWDAKDQDGNTIANGVYFYKLIIKKDNKIETQISKLAIIK